METQMPPPVLKTNEGVADCPRSRARGMIASPEGPDGYTPPNAATLCLSANHVK